MALVECHECGARISSGAKACVHCGAENPSNRPKAFLKALLLAAIVVLLVIAIDSYQEAMDRERDRAEIKRCDQHAADVLADRTKSIFVYDMAEADCQRLRDKYIQRWGPPET